MNIEKQLYKILTEYAKSNHKDGKVVGVSAPTLWLMKEGKGKTSFQKMFTVLFENGIQECRLLGKNTEMVINTEKREVEVKTISKA